MKSVVCKKAINFDLDTKALKTYYPEKDFRKAYIDIRKFMENEGFLHRQWSGYVSTIKVSNQKIVSMTKKLGNKFPWLKNCVKRFDVTDIGNQHDLTHIITGKCNTTVKTLDKSEKYARSEQKAIVNITRERLKQRAIQVSQSSEKQPSKNKTKSNNLER